MTDSLAVLRGTLDMLVLKALTVRPMHGFEITRWLEARSEQRLALEDAALYQALYRMEERGLVEAEWGVTEGNRQARFYRITSRGESHLEEQTTWWLRYVETLTDILMDQPEAV
ncbi:MAG: PadR family transcriptional regulator [Gemmatimonadetes bacterium]|nr:PadR family transcriptional regulator [Gemmatimonadota bacterium]